MTTQGVKHKLAAILSADVIKDTAASKATKMNCGGERGLK